MIAAGVKPTKEYVAGFLDLGESDFDLDLDTVIVSPTGENFPNRSSFETQKAQRSHREHRERVAEEKPVSEGEEFDSKKKDEKAKKKIKAYKYQLSPDGELKEGSEHYPFCEAHDGEVIAANDKRLPFITPPNHYNCKSKLIPVMVYEKDLTWGKGTYSDVEKYPMAGFGREGVIAIEAKMLGTKKEGDYYKKAVEGKLSEAEYKKHGYTDKKGFLRVQNELNRQVELLNKTDIRFKNIKITDRKKGVYEISGVKSPSGMSSDLKIKGKIKVKFGKLPNWNNAQQVRNAGGDVVTLNEILTTAEFKYIGDWSGEKAKYKVSLEDIFMHEFAEIFYKIYGTGDTDDGRKYNNYWRKENKLYEIVEQHGALYGQKNLLGEIGVYRLDIIDPKTKKESEVVLTIKMVDKQCVIEARLNKK